MLIIVLAVGFRAFGLRQLYRSGFAYIKSLSRFQRNSISLTGYLQIRGFWDQIWQNSFGFFLIDFGRYCLLSWVFLFEDLILVL